MHALSNVSAGPLSQQLMIIVRDRTLVHAHVHEETFFNFSRFAPSGDENFVSCSIVLNVNL